MEYREVKRNNNKLSLLGFGVMRLKSNKGQIDMDLAQEQIKYSIDQGVNYFDTAYLYGNGFGSNEQALGQILENLNCRQNVYISTKMNRMAIHKKEDMYEMFENQLNNLKTTYIDYYFIHNVISFQDITDLIDIGLLDFIEEKKKNNEIINIGFSYHGSYDDFEKIRDLYDWDATLLQYNYLDNNMQAGIKGIKLANKKDMAVIIMEPLKGGLLAGKMPTAVEKLINKSSTNRSNVDLALSWIYNTPEVNCVLSGMNTIEMIKENIEITNNYSTNPLNDDELALINEIKKIILDLNKIDCTSCNYCMPCPKDINIPDTFRLYNDKHLFPDDKTKGIHHTTVLYIANIIGVVGKAHDASLCVDCGLCTSKCPQRINIPEKIREVNKSYHGNVIKPFVPLIKFIMKLVM